MSAFGIEMALKSIGHSLQLSVPSGIIEWFFEAIFAGSCLSQYCKSVYELVSILKSY
jgi:hypothetical protein